MFTHSSELISRSCTRGYPDLMKLKLKYAIKITYQLLCDRLFLAPCCFDSGYTIGITCDDTRVAILNALSRLARYSIDSRRIRHSERCIKSHSGAYAPITVQSPSTSRLSHITSIYYLRSAGTKGSSAG